jgi:hypothetical protein
VIELQKQLGQMFLCACLLASMIRFSFNFGGLNIYRQTETGSKKPSSIKTATTRVLHSTIRTLRTLTQEFSINELFPGTYMYACTQIADPQYERAGNCHSVRAIMPPDMAGAGQGACTKN